MAETEAVSGNVRFKIPAGEWTVDIASLPNIIRFERHFNVSADVLQRAPRLEYIAFMAWSAAKRDNLPVPAKFDAFVDDIIDLEVVDNEDTADSNPTDGGPQAER